MPTVYLIRHQEPAIRGVFLGQLDPPLSEEGRSAALRLCNLEMRAVYSSNLRRAVETAECIRCTERSVLPELREIDYGEWTGLSWEQIESQWQSLAAAKCKDWLHVAAPSGEGWDDFTERVANAWTIVQGGPFPAAIVAHQAVNSALAQMIEGRDPLRFEQAFGEVIPIEFHIRED